VDRIAMLRTFIIDELSADPADLERTDTRLVEEDVIDSLGIFLLVDFIENRFSVEVDPEEIRIENFATLAAIDAFVERTLKAS
jgi:acyl carrier protein